MDADGNGQWSQVFPRLGLDVSGRLRDLLARAEAAQRNSADRLRAVGAEDLALTAEQFAEWVRFELAEPESIRRLHEVMKKVNGTSRRGLLLDRALDGALSLLGAPRGNIQLVDPATRSLKIVAERGFDVQFLDYFAVVHDDGSACGRTAKEHAQTVIADVDTDPGFAPHREIAAASGFRAVLSTPLIDSAGRLRGVVSVHYPRPHRPLERDLGIMKRYGERVGRALANCALP